jgi:hypothetical protein
MTALSKSALKALWKAYFQPTSADFSNLIDSWADYSPFIASFTAAVSGGSTGIVKAVSPTTAQFLPSGAFGESMLAATTTAAAQSILNITYPVSVANGGTGVASLSANHVVLGNGTSAVQLVAPGASGNVLTSNGTTWASSAPSSSTGTLVAGTTLTLDPIALNTRTTQAHGLSSTPVMFAHYLECKTAELGYVAGDRISIHASILVPSGATVVMQVRADSTNTILEITNNSLPSISSKTASPPGAASSITAANWIVRIIPYALT